MVDGLASPTINHQLTAQVNLTTSHQCQFVEIVCQHHQSHQPPVIEIGKGDLQNLRLEYTPKKSNLILLGVVSKVGLCLFLKVTITKKKDRSFFPVDDYDDWQTFSDDNDD